jgi:hypothetical protein
MWLDKYEDDWYLCIHYQYTYNINDRFDAIYTTSTLSSDTISYGIYTFNYNDQQQLIEFDYDTVLDGSSFRACRSTYDYDDEGRVTTILYERFYDNWISRNRTLYTYDSVGLNTSWTSQEWSEDEGWYDSEMEIITYANHQPLERWRYGEVGDIRIMAPFLYTDYYYDTDGRPASELDFTMGRIWYTSGRTTFLYNEDGTIAQKLYENRWSESNDLQYSSRNLFTYSAIVSADIPAPLPSPSRLTASNYPNPFNPSTTISYSLPQDGRVELAIYNVKGQRIRTLISEGQVTGTHNITWDGTDDHGQPVGSGVYLYRLQRGSLSSTNKCILLK